MGRFRALRPHRIGVPVSTPIDKRKTWLRNRGRKKVRAYRTANGLCEICLAEGHYKWAQQVHHLDEIAEVVRRQGSMLALALAIHSDDRLLSVCLDHHKAIHAGQVDAELIAKIKGGLLGEGDTPLEC